ncbi:MAG: hypothetical protein L0Y72_12775 [Gemmataceae bacterium]|nr:hypothetical protein [Gemmataceae bacterium]MCI0739913.1 hypothetical protein [Gemmataceae bacterium]
MLAVCFLVLFQDGATHVNFHRIQLGMTRQQVERIVRQPPAKNVTDADRFSISFTVLSHDIRQAGDLWRSGPLRLWVVFDKDRVTGKMIEYDHLALMEKSNLIKKSP